MEPDPTIRQTGEDALVARLLPLMPSNAFLVTGQMCIRDSRSFDRG